MTIGTIKVGDIVQADIRGQRFYAEVEDRTTKVLAVRPLNGGVGKYRELTARQVVGHWRKRKARS